MHYLLFFPGQHPDAKQALREAGLPDFTSGARGLGCVLKNVPGLPEGDTVGLLVGWGESRFLVSDPDKQRVIDLPGVSYKLIVWVNDLPTPADLARSSQFEGWGVTFGRETESVVSQLFPTEEAAWSALEVPLSSWIVPTAARLAADVRLVDGQYQKIRKPMFDGYWNASAIWYRRWELSDFQVEDVAESDRIDWDNPEILQEMVTFVSKALRMNYRLTEQIAVALGLFTYSSLVRGTFSAIDGMQIVEVEQEKQRILELIQSRVIDEKKDTGSTITAC